jgi:predicted  nucleic acid-binding Zn-ribbon protein
MAEASLELIMGLLKKIQDGQVELRTAMVELRTDMRDLKETQLSTREEIQALRRDVMRQERNFAGLQLDMDKVKNLIHPHHAD